MANFLLSQFARKEENLNAPQQRPQDEWLALLRRLQAERGNGILALLEAKRQRPDLLAIWNGQKPASTQLELFTTDEPHTSQNAAKSVLGGNDAKP